MLTGILAGLAAGALWGLVFVAPDLAPGLTPVDLAAGRFASYGLAALLAMALARGPLRWPTRSQLGAALGLSALGFSGYYLLLVFAIRDAGDSELHYIKRHFDDIDIDVVHVRAFF